MVSPAALFLPLEVRAMSTEQNQQEAAAAVEELMESEGIKWKQAYRLGVTELSESNSEED